MPRVPAAKVNVPKPATLKRYGLTAAEWLAILKAQGNVCAVCRKVPLNGRLCTDHEHVKGWKKMKPEQRRLYVRGMLCFFCNHYLVGRSITVAKAEATVLYLRTYETRRSNCG
jgi:hypothetical protein